MTDATQNWPTRKCGSIVLGVVALWLCADTAAAQRAALIVDTAASHIYAITYRNGVLSFLGHDHVITAPRWSAEVCLDRAAVERSYARFVVDAGALIIDDDSARRRARLGSGPSRRQREQLQRKMLDAAHLNAAVYPELRFESTAVASEDQRNLRVQGHLTIRGVSHVVAMPALIEQYASNQFGLSGKLTVKQTAFGIKPESIAGVVKVADAIDLFIRLQGMESSDGCR